VITRTTKATRELITVRIFIFTTLEVGNYSKGNNDEIRNKFEKCRTPQCYLKNNDRMGALLPLISTSLP
jgi:hypothetical protein